MEDSDATNSKSQQSHRNADSVAALEALVAGAGFDAGDLLLALEAIKTAKEQSPKKDDGEYKFFLDRTLIYDDRDAFIYKRATSKAGIWYFRIYDGKRNKPVVRSLKTKDKIQALASARLMYIDIKGKIERGERLKTITTIELVELWTKKLKTEISDIPRKGIMKEHYRLKRYFLDNWIAYMKLLGYAETPIDKVEPYKTREFGKWLLAQPKKTNTKTSRSEALINNNISEILRMYKQLAIRDKYISNEQIPELDKLKVQIGEREMRDIMNEQQYEMYWRYLEHKYIRDKTQTPAELEKRKIFKEYILILSNVGFRNSELLGMKLKEIDYQPMPNWSKETRDTHLLMKVRRENSKTGRGRVCVAPVKKRINRILTAYKKLGIEHEPDDFLFMNPHSKVRKQYTRMSMYLRLKKTLIDSGVQDILDKEGKSITLYSFRHQFCCWRLKYGDVPIHLLAKQIGSSVNRIMSTYGHIEVMQEAEKITKAQGYIRKTGFILETPEVYEESL